MRVDIIGHLKSCMTDIYLYIDARTADSVHTHPYTRVRVYEFSSHCVLCTWVESQDLRLRLSYYPSEVTWASDNTLVKPWGEEVRPAPKIWIG